MRGGTKIRRKDKNGNNHGGGRHQFVPTKEQRDFVAAMGAFRMKWAEIAAIVVDPKTGKAISRATLARKFKDELAQASPKLMVLAQTQFLRRLQQGDWNAIAFAMRHMCRYLEAVHPSLISHAMIEGETPDQPSVNVTFVLPSGRKMDDAIDVTPTDPYANQPADLSRPAIEPPRPRERTPFGAMWEQPPGKADWMK
jgi:hypothetical protein